MKAREFCFRVALSLVFMALLAGAVCADWASVSIGGGSMKRVLMDVDSDGYVDSLSVNYWYKNPGTGAGSWQAISTGWNQEVWNGGYQVGHANIAAFIDGQRVGDVNGDGLPDMVIGTIGWDPAVKVPTNMRDSIYVAINPGTQGTWSFYYIGTLTPATEDGVEAIEIGDMNNDGYPDIIAGGENHQVRWYVNPGSMSNNWSYYTLYTNTYCDIEGMALTDFNSDGYLDIAATSCASLGGSGATFVLLNPKSNTGNWPCYTLDTSIYSCMETISVGDLDGDGDMDVIVGIRKPFVKSYLSWYKNKSNGTSWSSRILMDTLSTIGLEGQLPVVVDVDLDGYNDVICYRKDSAASLWYKNNGSGSSWVKKQITTNSLGSYYAVGDVDNDGDIDIICGGRWYKNPTN